MRELNLFHELCETILDYDDGIEISHQVYMPALGKLRSMADGETIDRCLKKLIKWRKDEK